MIKDLIYCGVGASTTTFIVTRGLSPGAAVVGGRVTVGYRRRRRWMRHTVWLGWLLMGRLLG